jgi:hypothetical protein
MASLFELEQPTFGRSTTGKIVVAGADAATSLTAEQCIESIITVTPTTGRAYTTATAAAIIAALGDTVKVGQTFEVTVVNLAGSTAVLLSPPTRTQSCFLSVPVQFPTARRLPSSVA